MSLTATEIEPGVIAYFDADLLNKDAAVTKSGDLVNRGGLGNQFVCYKVEKGISYWAPLTASARPERLQIQAAWVGNGYGPLANGSVYLQDGKNTYAGPKASFVAAAAKENPFTNGRPIVLAAGVNAIAAVVAARKGQI